MAQDLTRLVAKAQKGNENALNDLITQCYDDLYYFAYKTVKDEDLAADITQESCIIILQKLNTLTQPGAFQSWARQVVYHQCTHHFRDTHEVQATENEDGETIFDTLADTDTSVMPEAVAQDKEFQRIMQSLLNELPAEQRSALMLYYYEKLSVGEIASIQGTTPGTVKSRLNYGRKAVKNKVEEYEKANDVRLHSAAFVPVLLYFLFKIGEEESAGAGAAVVPGIMAAAAGTTTAASAGTSAGVGLAIVTGVVAAVGVVSSFVTGFVAPPDPTTLLESKPTISTTVITTRPQTTSPSTAPTHSTAPTTMPSTAPTTTAPTQPTQPEDTVPDPPTPPDDAGSDQPAGPPAAEYTYEGIVYAYQEETNSYAVTGATDATLGDMEILESIEGVPVTTIEYKAFANRTDLTSVLIPDSVLYIGQDVFRDCKKMTQATISNNLETLGPYAFYGCSALTSVTIPDSVKTIEQGAFYNCSGITSMTIPDGVTAIGESAFSGCSSLTSISIPGSVTSIGDSLFIGCSRLASIIVDSSNPAYTVIDNVLFTKDMKQLISCAGSKSGVYQIPNGVSSINSNAFNYCSKLTSVIIPDSVTIICSQAFSGCSGLIDVSIPNSVTTIEFYAFSGCSSMTSLHIPASVTDIGGSAFQFCYDLATLTVDSKNPNYASVDNVLFSKDMKTLILCPMTKTGVYEIPSGVETIGASAFKYCTGLTSVIIPDGVTGTKHSTFHTCTKLTSITIPASLTTLFNQTFQSCQSLTDIQFKGTMAQWNAITKGTSWNNGTGDYVVHCTDGDIPKA